MNFVQNIGAFWYGRLIMYQKKHKTTVIFKDIKDALNCSSDFEQDILNNDVPLPRLNRSNNMPNRVYVTLENPEDDEIYDFGKNIFAVIVDIYEDEHPTISKSLEKCPICLDIYTLPRITKCGHIFCYGCLMGCFKHAELYIKCPICYELLSENEFKNIIFRHTKKLEVGGVHNFALYRVCTETGVMVKVSSEKSNTLVKSLAFDMLWKEVEYLDNGIFYYSHSGSNELNEPFKNLCLQQESTIVDLFEVENNMILEKSKVFKSEEEEYKNLNLALLDIRKKKCYFIAQVIRNMQIPSKNLDNKSVDSKLKMETWSIKLNELIKYNWYLNNTTVPNKKKGKRDKNLFYYCYRSESYSNLFLSDVNMQQFELNNNEDQLPLIVECKIESFVNYKLEDAYKLNKLWTSCCTYGKFICFAITDMINPNFGVPNCKSVDALFSLASSLYSCTNKNEKENGSTQIYEDGLDFSFSQFTTSFTDEYPTIASRSIDIFGNETEDFPSF